MLFLCPVLIGIGTAVYAEFSVVCIGPCSLLAIGVSNLKELICCNITSKEYGHCMYKWPQAG